MAERRKTAHSRKTATRKLPAKTGQRRPGKRLGAGENIRQKRRSHRKALVAARDAGKRRARSEARRVHTDRSEEDRGFAQALGGTSSRRKAGAYRSALSMLTFYINRAGKTLPKPQRERLQRAKTELKHQFGRSVKLASSRVKPGIRSQ